jgi:hypothetical protein
MKKIKVLHKFRDINNFSHIYGVGEVVAFDDARAANIVERGLGEYVTPKAETKKHEPVAPAAAPADGGKVAEGAAKETEEKNDGTNDDESESTIAADPAPAAAPAEQAAEQSAETAEVHEPAAEQETKAPKSKGTRKGGKKAE